MSDCKPIYDNGKLTWYLQNADKLTFCQLDYENNKLTTKDYYDDFYLTTRFMNCLPDGNLITWPKLSDVTAYRFVRHNYADENWGKPIDSVKVACLSNSRYIQILY